jgi:hypothetical protein
MKFSALLFLALGLTTWAAPTKPSSKYLCQTVERLTLNTQIAAALAARASDGNLRTESYYFINVSNSSSR